METIDLDKILLANNIDEILNTDSLKKIFINILKDKYKELSSIDIDELFNFDYSKKFASEKYQELDTLLELIKLENVDKLPKYKVTFKPTGTATLSLSKHAISFNKVKFDSPIVLTLLDASVNKGVIAESLGYVSYICINKNNPYKIFFIQMIFNQSKRYEKYSK